MRSLNDFIELSGFGSVTGVPSLPPGFTNRFKSIRIETSRSRHHVVTGGEGPPLLLLGGWPQCWFAWRHLMPALARDFTVIAIDPRGVGLSDKPRDGYDGLAQAADMFALTEALDLREFAFVGHDIGMWTGFAMAATNPGPIKRMVVGEAIVPGLSPSPPLLPASRFVSDLLSHFNFNRMLHLNEQLVAGREEIYFGFQFASKAATPDAVPSAARDFYIELLRDPEALRAGFDFYRALDLTIPQNEEMRSGPKIQIPVATFAGRQSCSDMVEAEWRCIADNVTSVVFENCGHFVAEERPNELLEFITGALASYREEV